MGYFFTLCPLLCHIAGPTKDRKVLMPPKRTFFVILCCFNMSKNFQYHHGITQHLFNNFCVVISHKSIIILLTRDSQMK